MQTVIETQAFIQAARRVGMSEVEVTALVDMLAANPAAGDEMQGTGGCRKLRVAGRGKGKSGGFRVITFYTGASIPLFLLTVFSKGSVGNLTKAERNALHVLTKELIGHYQK